jgi:transposase-like protein
MDDVDVPPPDGPSGNKRKRKDLTHEQRREIVCRLLLETGEGPQNVELKHGAVSRVARHFGVVPTTVGRIWKRARQSLTDDTLGDFQASPLKKGNCGRPQVYNRDEVREAIKDVPLHQGNTLSTLGSALGIPKTTLRRMIHDKEDCIVLPRKGRRTKKLG